MSPWKRPQAEWNPPDPKGEAEIERGQTSALLYVFRSPAFPGSNTVASAAALDLVVAVFGGGGMKGEQGLAETFGGAAFFRNEETGESYLGVWGARKVSRFRSRMRVAGGDLRIIREPPPARLVWRQSIPAGR